MAAPRQIALLGSTGSIGTQTLEVVEAFPERFRVLALSCARSVDTVVAQARRHRPRLVAVSDPAAGEEVAQALSGAGIEVATGPGAAARCAALPEVDLVLAAASGVAGLPAVWQAVARGKVVALANKEPLVVAGHLILAEAARTGAQLLPVDSEHSAIFQALLGQDRRAVKRVLLTASGGPFRDLCGDQLDRVTPAQALAHPTWKMGPKVTVDSATLMNKGLELIEARWLFALEPAQLEVILHRESIVHSLVEFVDGSVLAQLGVPDMRLPIQFALSYPERLPGVTPSLDLTALGALHFQSLPPGRFPCLELARAALAAGGTAPAALNAADEIAVTWFLEERIGFGRIPQVVEAGMRSHEIAPGGSVEELLAVDREVRDYLTRMQATWT